MKKLARFSKIFILALIISATQHNNLNAMDYIKQTIFSAIRHTPENIAYACKTKYLREVLLAGLGLTALGIASGIAGIKSESENNTIIFGSTGIATIVIGTGTAICCTHIIAPIHQMIYNYIMHLRRQKASGETG